MVRKHHEYRELCLLSGVEWQCVCWGLILISHTLEPLKPQWQLSDHFIYAVFTLN